MSTVDQILGEFIDAWKAGRRPDLDAYLARAPAPDRDELAVRLAGWLEIAPTPRYDPSTRAAIRREPALRAALEQMQAAEDPLAERVAALRQRAGLDVRDVARRLVALFELDDEQRTARYLTRIEGGQLDPRRLSRRLLDALAAILRAEPEQLAPVGPAAGQAFFRADADTDGWIVEDIDALSRAALAPAPAPMDELDRLFLGGPDA